MKKIFDSFRKSLDSAFLSFERSFDEFEKNCDEMRRAFEMIDADLGEGEEKTVVTEERRADGSIVITKTVVRKIVRRVGEG